MQKIHKLPIPLLNARRMPRLSLEQQEQSIGRLNAGQQLIAQAFNVYVCTIQRLLECYNATKNIDDRARSGRSISATSGLVHLWTS